MRTHDPAQIFSRLQFKGVVDSSAGSDDAYKFVRTNADGLVDDSFMPPLVTDHIADDSRHLTTAENALLDAIAVTATEINRLSGVSSNIQNQFTTAAGNLATHIADTTLHLTAPQNTLLDGISVTYTKINYLTDVTSNIQAQIDTVSGSVTTVSGNLTAHIADTTKHLTSSQNTLLDGITVTYTKVNYLTDVTSNIQAQFSDKLDATVIDTDNTLAANSDSKVASQKAIKSYVDSGISLSSWTEDSGWAANGSTGSRSISVSNYVAPSDFTGSDSVDHTLLDQLATQVANLTGKLQAIQEAMRTKKYPNN